MDITERLYSAIEASPALGDFSGIILVKQAGKEIYVKTAGFSDLTNQIANTTQTRFATASVTKMFTAVAILQLIQNGKLSFDTRVIDYLRLRKTSIDENILVSHLLTHTSGMGDYFNDAEPDAYEKLWEKIPNYSMRKLEHILPLFINKSPVFKPTSKFMYCDAGYILLGLIIEKASGISYFDWVCQKIFKRAGMADSDFLSLEQSNANTAEGYIPLKDASGEVVGWKKNIYAVPVNGASDGGAFMTAEDGYRFMYALRMKKLLNDEFTREILLPRVNDDDDWKYGYGIWFQVDKGGKIKRYGHSGEDPGVSCRVYYYPAFDVDITILGNRSLCAGSIMDRIDKAITKAN